MPKKKVKAAAAPPAETPSRSEAAAGHGTPASESRKQAKAKKKQKKAAAGPRDEATDPTPATPSSVGPTGTPVVKRKHADKLSSTSSSAKVKAQTKKGPDGAASADRSAEHETSNMSPPQGKRRPVPPVAESVKHPRGEPIPSPMAIASSARAARTKPRSNQEEAAADSTTAPADVLSPTGAETNGSAANAPKKRAADPPDPASKGKHARQQDAGGKGASKKTRKEGKPVSATPAPVPSPSPAKKQSGQDSEPPAATPARSPERPPAQKHAAGDKKAYRQQDPKASKDREQARKKEKQEVGATQQEGAGDAAMNPEGSRGGSSSGSGGSGKAGEGGKEAKRKAKSESAASPKSKKAKKQAKADVKVAVAIPTPCSPQPSRTQPKKAAPAVLSPGGTPRKTKDTKPEKLELAAIAAGHLAEEGEDESPATSQDSMTGGVGAGQRASVQDAAARVGGSQEGGAKVSLAWVGLRGSRVSSEHRDPGAGVRALGVRERYPVQGGVGASASLPW